MTIPVPGGEEVTIKIHEIAVDGLPDMDALSCRVAFIFDGCIVSGWPLSRNGLWEADSDVGHGRPFDGVTHWVEFPEMIKHYEMEK